MAVFSVFYGLFTIIGGLIGFLKAQSKASLIAGIIAGDIILACSWLMYQEKNIMGYYGLMGISGLLLVYFAQAFIKTKKIMPAAVMVLLSLVSVALLILNPLLTV